MRGSNKHPYSYSRALSAEAKLPEGPPAGKGHRLDDSIPGYRTFSKPEEDTSEPTTDPGSIYRVDDASGIAKEWSPGDGVDHSQAKPSYFGGPGGRDPDDYSITKYPYRNDKRDTHNASVEYVSGTHTLRHKLKVAANLGTILSGLNPEFKSRAQKVKVDLRRADTHNLRWLFSVKGNNTYAVSVRALRPGGTVRLSKMDLELSCSCPAWQWQGPEYHSTQETYQLGKPRGTATTPDIRDPNRENRVCKHVAAVLDSIKMWTIPKK